MSIPLARAVGMAPSCCLLTGWSSRAGGLRCRTVPTFGVHTGARNTTVEELCDLWPRADGGGFHHHVGGANGRTEGGDRRGGGQPPAGTQPARRDVPLLRGRRRGARALRRQGVREPLAAVSRRP